MSLLSILKESTMTIKLYHYSQGPGSQLATVMGRGSIGSVSGQVLNALFGGRDYGGCDRVD